MNDYSNTIMKDLYGFYNIDNIAEYMIPESYQAQSLIVLAKAIQQLQKELAELKVKPL